MDAQDAEYALGNEMAALLALLSVLDATPTALATKATLSSGGPHDMTEASDGHDLLLVLMGGRSACLSADVRRPTEVAGMTAQSDGSDD